jgi:hypothetical protein
LLAQGISHHENLTVAEVHDGLPASGRAAGPASREAVSRGDADVDANVD